MRNGWNVSVFGIWCLRRLVCTTKSPISRANVGKGERVHTKIMLLYFIRGAFTIQRHLICSVIFQSHASLSKVCSRWLRRDVDVGVICLLNGNIIANDQIQITVDSFVTTRRTWTERRINYIQMAMAFSILFVFFFSFHYFHLSCDVLASKNSKAKRFLERIIVVGAC